MVAPRSVDRVVRMRLRVDWRRHRLSCWLGAVAIVLLLPVLAGRSAAAQDAEAGRRVALVVGNDAYRSQSVLRNAVNDARAVKAALEDVGFLVTLLEDVTRARLTAALGGFASSLGDDDVALFFFAGHGVQIDGTNYLIPVDYAGRSEFELTQDTVSVVDVERLLRSARVAMLVLDACRNNPYRGMRSGGTGLAPMEARGTLIAYSAGADQLADDAPDAANGLFTGKFVEALEEPGLTAAQLFDHVRLEVYTASRGEQHPAVYNALLSNFIFRAAEPDLDAVAVALLQQENNFWEAIDDSSNPGDFRAYLTRYPDGAYVPLARNRLASLLEAASGPPPASPSASLSRPEASRPSSDAAVATSAPSASRPEVLRPSSDAAAATSAPLVSRPEASPPSSGTVAITSAPSIVRPAVGEAQAARRLSERLGRELSARRSDENGWTDLHYAAALNLPGVVGDLSRAGAASNAKLKADGNRLTGDLVRILSELGQATDESWTRDGETPLHIAASFDAVEAARTLLARGANTEERTTLNWTPLHYAAWTNANGVVEILVTARADVNARVVGDWTPLHLAAWADSHEAAAALLAAGADVAARNGDGDTASELAKSNRMRTLLSRRMRR